MTLQTLNGVQLTQAALKESDRSAFNHLLQTLLKDDLDPAGFQHGAVTVDPLDPSDASVEVTVDRGQAHVNLWKYRDGLTLRYRRVALSAVAARYGSVIRADLPATVRDLMAVYLTGQALHDRSDQIEDSLVEQVGPLTVSVLPDRFLLYGNHQFTVKPLQRQLAQVLTTTAVVGFLDVVDFVDDPTTQLLQQLTVANTLPYELEPELLVWSDPVKVNGYITDNTTIEVEAVGDGYYLGKITVTYARYDFGWSTNGAQFEIEGPSTPTTWYILEQVQLLTGMPLTLSDVVQEAYAPIAPGELNTLTVFFSETNLRYTGELTIDYRAV